MPLSTAHVITDRPERYAKQLISHLGHKAHADRGRITFRSGTCSLVSSHRELVLIAAAADLDAHPARRAPDRAGGNDAGGDRARRRNAGRGR